MASLRLAFAGTPDFAAQHLRALLASQHELVAVLTQPDRPAGRGKQAKPSPVKVLGAEHGLAVMQPPSLRDAAAKNEIAALGLDALVVVAYGLLLPQSVLDLPRHGCLNVHGSLLPRWRGAAPIQRAVEAGDPESGVTIMQMEAGLDTGPILACESCPIPPLATSGDLYTKLAQIGPTLLLKVLNDLPEKLREAEVQDDSRATHAAKITKSEAQLDWRQPARVLARRIRAFNPAPGCFSFLDGARVKLWDAQPRPGTADAEPGYILSADERGIVVACGEGALVLERLQLPGAKAMLVADVLRGRAELFAAGKTFSASTAL